MSTYYPNRIRELRQAKGWSARKLGSLCVPEASQGALTKLENGRVKLTLEWMMRLAPALGVEPIELMQGLTWLSEEELALLAAFRSATLTDRDVILRIAQAVTAAP